MDSTSQTGATRQPRPPARIAGREREQRLLCEQLDAAAGGGRLVLVGGEAGIGKTALVGWLTDEALCQDALVLSGGCYDLTVTPPYGPWLDAFERYVPEDGSPPRPSFASDAAIDTLTWFETVQTFLAELAANRTLVLILEDLHWADPASLDLLRHLARRRDRLRILLLGTYRNDEITREHPLFQFLPLLVREADAERLDLRRLDQAAILATIAGRYDLSPTDEQRLAAYLARHSDGNPLYLTELLRTLESERLLWHDGERWTLLEPPDALVPPLLQQVIDRRLSRLHPATRDALTIAAIIGYEVPVGLWAAVSGLTDEALAGIVEEAVEAHVLEERPAGAGLRFSHALVREAIHERMPLPRRRVWHRRVAEALISSSNPSPDEVAYHLQQAGDERAVEWFVRAGLRARRSEAWITAAERFATAADFLENDDSHIQERGWLLFLTAFLLRFSDGARSVEFHDKAERLAAIAGDTVLDAYVHYARGAVYNMRGDIRLGMRDLESGVVAIDALITDHHLLSTEDQAMSVIQRLLPDGGDGARIHRHKIGDEPAADRPRPEPRVNLPRGVLINWCGHTGRYADGIRTGEAYLTEMEAAFGPAYPRVPQCYSGLNGMGEIYAALARPADALRMLALSRFGAEAASDYAVVEMTHWTEQLMVLIPYLADEPAARQRLIADANRAWERCVGVTIIVAGQGATSEMQCDLLEGRWQKAMHLATNHLDAPWVTLAQEAVIVLGTLANHQGQPSHAWERVNQLLPEGAATKPGNSYFAHAITAIALAAELALDASDLPAARRWIETHGRWLDWSEARLWHADQQILWTRYHDRSGNLTLARQHAESALRLASDPRQPLRIVAAQRLLGQLDTRAGDAETAEARLAESLRLAEACAAPFEQALSLLALAELRLCTGQTAEALLLLDHVRAICLPLEARPTLERVAELEARIGTGRNKPDGLTAREVEVLRLIASGQSNRQIADTLFLSPRTIERHIANIYLKIDAHNKTEATAYARRHTLT